MSGWIKLHRKIQDSPMYKSLSSKQRDVMIQCLLLANHEENEWAWGAQLYKCKPGQFVTSLDSLKKHCAKDISIASLRTSLLKLENLQFLTNISTKTGRLITICKYGSYQLNIDEATKTPTKTQQRPNKDPTPNKNDKELKKKKEYAEFVFLTIEEYKKLLDKYGEDKTALMINKLDNHKGASGQKYKSDYRAILKWVVDAVSKEPHQKKWKHGYQNIFN